MVVKIYSHSRLGTFEQCPLKFKFQYIDKIIPEVKESIESYLGRTVHSTLEWLYLLIQKKITPKIDEVITHYSIEWEKNFPQKIIITNKSLTPRDFFNKGVGFILNYYMKHKPFSENIIEVEKKIMLNLDEEGDYKIQGFIDRLDYNLKTREYEIHDYKTNNGFPHKEKIENDRQLALYSLAIKELFGMHKEVLLIWHFLAHNLRICSKRKNEELQQLKENTLQLIKKIEATEKFNINKSILCNWCEYKTMCPAFGNQPVKTESQSKLTDEEIEKRELDIWD